MTATLAPSEIVMRNRAWVTVHAVARAHDAARETGNRDLVRMLARAAEVALEVAADCELACALTMPAPEPGDVWDER